MASFAAHGGIDKQSAGYLPGLFHNMNTNKQTVRFSPSALRSRITELDTDGDGDSFRPRKIDTDLPHLSRSSSFTVFDAPGDISEVPWYSRVAYHFNEEVDTSWCDMLLLACSFASGVIDSLAFNAWGSFASMQTGNVVFLALGVSGQPAYPSFLWAKCLIGISSFIIGVLFFIYGSRFLQPLRRSTLVISFTIQTLAILTASVLVQTGVVDSKHDNPSDAIDWMQVLPIALLAFQAGGQIVASRVLRMDEIPTLVLTTALCDLLVDLKGGWHDNPARNRRIGTCVALFIGAMVSGGLSKAAGLSSSLWLATGVKVVITLCWVGWKGKGRADEEMGGC
ncbi:hypothetical protein FQN52_004470 [Onygenales sp. PD_12]|nr:hypothetical protein FQN52_004470 [Onygenales sp. PD_12]